MSARSYVHLLRVARAAMASLLLLQLSAAHAETPARKPEEVALDVDDGKAPKLVPPENIESLIFFSEKPKHELGERQRKGAALLEKMLHDRERLVRERRTQAIAQLGTFVGEEPESAPEMPDALLRLAELRWEEARDRYLQDYDAWQKAPEKVRAQEPPTADVTVALALYDRILTKHRDFDRYDLVLYMKAFALMEAGRMGDALVEYKRILDEFPNSKFVPDAHMAFAESLFNGSHDYAAALKRYQDVLRYPESELSDLALFKSAWCLWKLGKTTEAATRFRQVLDLDGKLAGASADRRRRLLELQDEALEYLIQVFTEDERNTAADLHEFLAGIGGDRYAERVLRRLSRAFFDQGRFARAIEAYSMLLTSQPEDPNAPQYQRQIAAAYAALDDTPHTVEALKALAENYGPSSSWAQKQADPSVVTRAHESAERAVRTQAMRYHERAQKEKQTVDFEHAAQLYRVHVTNFPDSPSNYEVTFYLAELLFHRLNKQEEAGEYYLKAAKANPKGKFTKDALYNAIVAFETVRTQELAGCGKGEKKDAPPPAAGAAQATLTVTPLAAAGTAGAKPDAKPEPKADPCSETPTDHKFSDAVGMYVQLYPSDPEVPGILFRQGRMYFERGIYDPAIRQFGQLLDSYPNSEFAATAGELVLESFNRAKDYANIEKWARKLKSAPAFANAESQKKLDSLILQSVFKSGEQLAAAGKHIEAAAAYERASQEFPRDERAPKALYNAGQEYQRAGELESAAGAYDALIEHYPRTSEGALGAWSAAQMFESIAQFTDAARYYEAYGSRFPQAEKREDALYNALLLRVAAGDNQDAVRDGNDFVKAFPNSKSADEVYFLIGRAQEADKRWQQAAQTYRHYALNGRDAGRKVEAYTRLGLVLIAVGDRDGADKAWTQAAKSGRKAEPSARYYAAQARFSQGDQALAEFEKIKIAGDVKTLGKRLQQKSELLRKASEIYGDVVDYRVAEWVTAALYKIGESYEHFAESLRDAPIPPNLNEEEEQAYRDQLAQFIVPIEERALEAYENGYHKALELRVFNAWTQKQREALTRLNDVEYPPLREAGVGLTEARLLPLPATIDGLRRAPLASGETPAVASPSEATKPVTKPAAKRARKRS
ncbi:MAG TPA: tetratricopeptide repeat protein [Polyangiales bacterium]|nr:tetratricopeptide repeat protein [Polyangiales bacterium]